VFLLVVIAVHLWGSRRNRNKARGFISAIAPVLTKEFALVGYSDAPLSNTTSKTELGSGPEESPKFDVTNAVKSNSHLEYVSYASGRQNIAFMHTTLKLQRRNNPIAWFIEYAVSFFLDSVPEPLDSITMTISPFDGNEFGGRASGGISKYDNFVWALVNKRHMRRWRDERYDLSLTRTSDWEGLPNWLAVMGESKEVGDTCLYKDLKDIVVECGSFLEYLLITDMPKDKPVKLAELTPKKRLTLELTLPSSSTSPEVLQRLVSAFIRLVDHLVVNAKFRPEALRKIKATREDEKKKLKRAIEEETKEERETQRAEEKKADREAKLRRMTAAEQKKFLDREREKERKDLMKKQSRKG